ncbi:B12-binding domain-containing radical SAM protein [Desulfosudis oleivorans]|uniref:Radical SAM domain protein n=1 Tax=Desulfosudis oleivorans (strain DSM 6200 / JCM 39069 / Hxd3) TaxID=96561 RepID=A9A0S1_DESOH|nr:radical SAM protein [Desulfosudis oleivorans]ABW67546.1 Radical SAM domain protein [Desulfosudis oleivorans Hxd3]
MPVMKCGPLRPIQRVMLIFPPFFDVKHVFDPMVCPPLGIASLAAYIRDRVDVAILDCVAEAPGQREPEGDLYERVGLSWDQILDCIRAFAPDMVGISCLFSNQFACVRVLSEKIKREIDPDMVVVAGGTHPSFLAEQTLLKTAVDYVVLGEGELGLAGILDAHNRGERVEEIDGIAFRGENGAIRVNQRTTWIENLDDLPLPARDLLPMEAYFKAGKPMAYHWRKRRNTPIVSSRGCPFGCPFCSSYLHWGKRFRTRSAENVLAEIAHLKSRYDIQELKWQDDNLTADRKRAMAIFRGMVDRGLTMPWNTPNGIALWTIDDELMGLMKQSGCYQITLAVESGDPDTFAAYVKKPFSLDRAREVARLAKKHGISTVAYFIIGFPGETLEQVQRSMRFGLDLGVDYLVPFVFNPLPGSDLWRTCVESGRITEDYAYEKGNHYHQARLNVAAFDARELELIQRRTYLRNLLRMPLRNPKEFAAWYGRQLFFQPDFLALFAANIMDTGKLLFQKAMGRPAGTSSS